MYSVSTKKRHHSNHVCRISAHTQSPICIFHGALVSWILSDEGDDVKGKICDPAEGSMSLSPSC